MPALPQQIHISFESIKQYTSAWTQPRSCASSVYKLEEKNRPRKGETTFGNVFNWRVLRWALIPAFILLLLAVTVYTVVSLSGEDPIPIESSGGVASLLDPGAHQTYARIPAGKVEEITESPRNGTAESEATTVDELGGWKEVSEQPNLLGAAEEEDSAGGGSSGSQEDMEGEEEGSDLMYSEGEVTFIDRLLSSFKESMLSNTPQQQQFTLLPPPNGHKYPEFQGALSRQIEVSTSSPLPVSPTLPSLPVKSHSSTSEPPSNLNESSACYSPRLGLCRGVLPWDLTTMPQVAGISSRLSLEEALPYFELVVQSGCSARSRQFLCSVLEPQCQPPNEPILPPCRKTCRAVAEECSDFILDMLDLSQIFNCDNYPDTEDPAECVNLARGGECVKNEIKCGDGSCIPSRWRCDKSKDCSDGSDEINCAYCNPQQFRCKSRDRCIPVSWRCDGRPDCPDRSDEFNCHQHQYERSSHSHASPCPMGELRCVDGRCIRVEQICNGARDCSDGADEANCGP